MWIIFSLLTVIFARGSLACNGCSLKDAKLSSCGNEASEILTADCEKFELTDSCMLVKNCSIKTTEVITSGKVKIHGKVGSFPVDFSTDNMCEFLANKTSDGNEDRMQMIMNMGLPMTCASKELMNGEYKEFKHDITKYFTHFPDFKGKMDITMQMEEINDKHSSLCVRVEGNMECSKKRKARE